MASLTQTAIATRKAIRYGIYGIIAIVIARYVFNFGVGIYHRIFPPPTPKPTVEFGKLPPIPFPAQTLSKTFTYTLETPEGKLPEFDEIAKVYYMPPYSSNLKSLDVAKEKAKSLGFNSEGKLVNEGVPNVYIFEAIKAPSNLVMDIITGSFSINYDVSLNQSIITPLPPTPEAASQRMIDMLKSSELLPEDAEERVEHQFKKFVGGLIVDADSLSDADLTMVNLFRDDYDDFPSVTPGGKISNLWFMLAGGDRTQVIRSEFKYYPVDKKTNSTYPLKTAKEAWEDLEDGSAYIATIIDDFKSTEIIIRRVYLGYYDPGQPSEYYQPVVVFEGDGDFIAYVPAVEDEYYGSVEVEDFSD